MSGIDKDVDNGIESGFNKNSYVLARKQRCNAYQCQNRCHERLPRKGLAAQVGYQTNNE